jgi:DNA-3-methyladenine glycosylase II
MTLDETAAQFSIEAALAHLRGDPVLARLIDQFNYEERRPPFRDPYAALFRAILYQQLAGAAAAAIERRLLALYGVEAGAPPPERLLATSDEELRAVGVSRQKASYLRDLAARVVDGRLDLGELASLSDGEVIGRLTAVKGVGEWTAHMFLMFQLGRPDVLPVGDLGVRNGMRLAYGLAATPTPVEASQIGAAWTPYRSVGAWFMWRAAEIYTLDTSP